jgi:hypothetical protein
MTEDILQRPITYVVKVSRTTTETALIPVVAMTAEEAINKAWARRSERGHEWKVTESKEQMHGIVDTRGFAGKWQTECYKEREKANDL